MPNPQAAVEALVLAAEAGDFVTVRTWDGRELRGMAAHHPTEPNVYTVSPGGRDRPALVHIHDVEELIAE